MKCGVIYYTKTGHSEKIARAVAQELHVQAEDIKTGPVMKELDLLFIVGGIYAGKSDPAMLGYISNIEGSMVKKVALITSVPAKERNRIWSGNCWKANKLMSSLMNFSAGAAFCSSDLGIPMNLI